VEITGEISRQYGKIGVLVTVFRGVNFFRGSIRFRFWFGIGTDRTQEQTSGFSCEAHAGTI
jgi:hypothetical protein